MIRYLIIALASVSLALSQVVPTYIITEGDSMTAGYGLEAGQDWPHLMTMSGPTINNLSRSGAKVEDCVPGTRISGPMTTDNSARQVAVLWIGYNDIKVPRTSAAITADITTWFNTIKTARPSAKIIISTVVDGGSFGSAGVLTAKRVILGELNTWIRANSLGFDAVVDVGASEQAADWEDTTWRDADGTHFNLAGTTAISVMFQDAILALYNDPPSGGTATAISVTAETLTISPP